MIKVLSPAGDFESLKMAIKFGADEIYLGVKDFNARNIEGFNLESLKKAVDYAHIFNVKVHLTVNILFDDEELQSALNLIVEAYNLGVDAFIIQDIGLISLVHKFYPEITIHASTQLGIHNLEGVKFLERYNVKRVVLSRETSLDEIKRIRENSNIEIEYFAHGALCVSFSGNCYLSSRLMGASGNRGKCKQLCRLPYTFKFDDKIIKRGYLLSAKDFNMLNRLNDLIDAGVDAIKIEGRARRPYYVGVTTYFYKKAIEDLKYKNLTKNNEKIAKNTDFLINNKNFSTILQQNDKTIKDFNELNLSENDLKLGFNRGFTAGYFDENSNIISTYPAHIGIKIGKVEKVEIGKRFNVICFSSNIDINHKSTLKFISKNEVTLSAFDISKTKSGYKITTKQRVNVGDQVYLISDEKKESELINLKYKRIIDIKIIAYENENIKAEINLNNSSIIVIGEMCEIAKTSPLTKDEIYKNFNKSEYFYPNLDIDIKNAFLNKSKLNEFRRIVYEKIYSELTKISYPQLEKKEVEILKSSELENVQYVENLNEKFNKNIIIYSPEIYNLTDIQNFKIKCENLNKIPYLDLPNFATNKDIKLLKNIIEKVNIGIVANNLYALTFNTNKIIGAGMNVYNSVTAKEFNLAYIKAENSKTDYVFPYMTLRHCPMKEHLNAKCENCPYKDGYSYSMQNGKTLKLKRKKLSSCTFYLV